MGQLGKMHGAQDDPGDSIDFTVPVLHVSPVDVTAADAIYDYMGLPWKTSLGS